MANKTNSIIIQGTTARMAGAHLNVARCMAERDEAKDSPFVWRQLAEALDEQAVAADECGQEEFAKLVRSDAGDCREQAGRIERYNQRVNGITPADR